MSQDNFVLTDELRARASEKPVFNILYVSDNDSKLAEFRGEKMLKRFASFYEKQAVISLTTATSNKIATAKLDDLKDYNILFIDNVNNFRCAKNLADIQQEILVSIEPNWKSVLTQLTESNKDEASKFVNKMNARKEEILRVVYAIDEFVWEGPIGRAHDIQTVQLMETFMNMADIVIVPTGELKEAIVHFKFVSDPNKAIMVIPTAVDYDFFPLYKDFTRKNSAVVKQLRENPRILIKGVYIPANVQEFIVENHKKMDITVCSVGAVNEHIQGLLARGKIKHIYHWANPFVNKRNMGPTYAIERDGEYDFVLHVKPDNLVGEMYEVTSGDEDIIFSIAYGALPICGVDHLGYDENSNHISQVCGITFGKDTTAKKIREIIEAYSVPVRWNEAFNKCRNAVEGRISTSPVILARYFSTFLGKEMSKARAELAKEKNDEIKIETEQQTEQPVADNVIVGNFGKEA